MDRPRANRSLFPDLLAPHQGFVIPWWIKWDPTHGSLHGYLFGSLMVLLIASYLRAWLSDPGTVPAGWSPMCVSRPSP